MAAVSPAHPEPMITTFRIESPSRLSFTRREQPSYRISDRPSSARRPDFGIAPSESLMLQVPNGHFRRERRPSREPSGYGRGAIRRSHEALQHADGGRKAELLDSRMQSVWVARPERRRENDHLADADAHPAPRRGFDRSPRKPCGRPHSRRDWLLAGRARSLPAHEDPRGAGVPGSLEGPA